MTKEEIKRYFPEVCFAMNAETFSKPNYCGMKQPQRYTFAYDMGVIVHAYKDKDEVVKEVDKYVEKVSYLYKGNKEAYCEMTNSLNKLSWACSYAGLDGLVDFFADWYYKFMYNSEFAEKYLNKEQIDYVRTYLD